MGLGGALSGTTEVPQSALNPSEPPSTASNRAFPLGLKVLLIDRLIYVLLRLLCAGDAENVNQPGFPLSRNMHMYKEDQFTRVWSIIRSTDF